MPESKSPQDAVAQLERRVRSLELALQQERRAMQVRTAYLASYLAVFQDAIRAVPVSTGDRQRDKAVLVALDAILGRLVAEWQHGPDNTDIEWLGMEASGRSGRDLTQIYEGLEAELGIHSDPVRIKSARRRG